jgi:dethiobiotin synthetase
LDALATRARALALHGDFLVVEGAGGLLVPYVGGETTADLCARLELPVMIVARTALGTVNHTALTVREARRAGLEIAAVILNRTEAAVGPQEFGNAELIASLTGLRPLGPVPYLPSRGFEDADGAADALVASLGERALDALFATELGSLGR